MRIWFVIELRFSHLAYICLKRVFECMSLIHLSSFREKEKRKQIDDDEEEKEKEEEPEKEEASVWQIQIKW